MANEEQFEIISEDGVEVWNDWRANNSIAKTDLAEANLDGKYLKNANFENTNLTKASLFGADLSNANLKNADLTGANLENAILKSANCKGAKFCNAILTKAKLMGVNFEGADLEDAQLTEANLSAANLDGANIRGTQLGGANFNKAKCTLETRGMGRLSQDQRSLVEFLDVESLSEDVSEKSDSQEPGQAVIRTVGQAKSVVNPAHIVFQNLAGAIPNDLEEKHLELFNELLRTVEELHNLLANQEEQKEILSEENAELRKKIEEAVPIWKKSWQNFVVGAGSGAAGWVLGNIGTYHAVYTAGFIAGFLHDAFNPGDFCMT